MPVRTLPTAAGIATVVDCLEMVVTQGTVVVIAINL